MHKTCGRAVSCQDRQNLTSAALRRARLVCACWDAPLPDSDCPTSTTHDQYCGLGEEFGDDHKIVSSLLLDGFSVDEVTRAGG